MNHHQSGSGIPTTGLLPSLIYLYSLILSHCPEFPPSDYYYYYFN